MPACRGFGTYRRGLVTTPSLIFELNTAADPKNLFDPALGEHALHHPRAGAAVKNLLGDRVHVQHLTVAPGTEASGATAGTVVVQQPLQRHVED